MLVCVKLCANIAATAISIATSTATCRAVPTRPTLGFCILMIELLGSMNSSARAPNRFKGSGAAPALDGVDDFSRKRAAAQAPPMQLCVG